MLTNSRLNKMMELLNKDNDYKLTSQTFTINCDVTNDENWGCKTAYNYTELIIQPKFNKKIFTIDFLGYLINEYGLDKDYVNYDYDTCITILVLLHEYSHSHRYNNMTEYEYYDYRIKADIDYKEYYKEMKRKYTIGEYNSYEAEIKYRRLPNESYADRTAVEIFNRYGLQLLSIFKGKAKKQIRLELSRMNNQ